MPHATPAPDCPPPGNDGLLLAAFKDSLTGHGAPGRTGAPQLRVDLRAGGDSTGPAGIAVVLADDDTRPRAEADRKIAPDEQFVPPDDDWCWTQPPDPDNGCPPELAGLTDEELQALITPAPLVPAPWPDGIVPPDGFPNPVPPTLGGPGFGFGQGDPLDTAAPGPALAALAEDTSAGLGEIDDDCLTGIIRAWRRITSWATGRELAAIAELARRRPTEGLPGSGREYVADELAAALTLTCRAAQDQRDLAGYLATVLPATLAALSAGRLDLARARVLATGTAELTAEHAAAVEAAVLPTAPGLTTGQLRAAVAKAVLTADPAAATRQREAAQAHAHVSCWTGQAGTAHLEGHDLPPAQTLAADARLGQIAAWKAHGAQGGADVLRAHAYLALLLGHDTTSPPASLLTPGHTRTSAASHPSPATPPSGGGNAAPGETGPRTSTPSSQVPAGLRAPQPEPAHEPEPGFGLPPVAAMINLTVPLATLLHLADRPGEAAGYGPLAPATAQALAGAAAGHPATRWQLTVTSPDGHAAATGTTRRRGGPIAAEGWTVTVAPIAAGDCDHHNQEPGYRPSPALAQLIRTRNTTCGFPGCRRPARRCDLDHTIPYEEGGRTCECGLAPLCRRHHRAKQAEGWTLSQPSPGVLVWLTPAGRRYTTLPSQHPT